MSTGALIDGERTELERLRAEVAALRKDAERYRWLRDIATDSDWEFISDQVADNTDAAIDVAMREQAMQELVDQAQELDMGYGERK